MNNEKIIGVVGGIGPHAGADLIQKILGNTIASRDQEHLSIAALSMPCEIADRSAFLLGQSDHNPAYAIANIILQLEKLGADVIGIPCNASHSPDIFQVITDELAGSGSQVTLLNMIEEVACHLYEQYSGLEHIGVLSVTGTYKSNIYRHWLELYGFKAVFPDEYVQQECIHKAVYDEEIGIKATSSPVHPHARQLLVQGIRHLQERGAEAVVLGCTELPLAVGENEMGGMAIIDSTRVLARSLIKRAAPHKLKVM